MDDAVESAGCSPELPVRRRTLLYLSDRAEPSDYFPAIKYSNSSIARSSGSTQKVL